MPSYRFRMPREGIERNREGDERDDKKEREKERAMKTENEIVVCFFSHFFSLSALSEELRKLKK